jgi:hypothetical protein
MLLFEWASSGLPIKREEKYFTMKAVKPNPGINKDMRKRRRMPAMPNVWLNQ